MTPGCNERVRSGGRRLRCYRESNNKFMQRFSTTCEAIAATTKKLQKTASWRSIYASERSTRRRSRRFSCRDGRFPFGRRPRCKSADARCGTIVAELAGKKTTTLTEAYRRLGDLGAVAGDVLPQRAGQRSELCWKSKRHFVRSLRRAVRRQRLRWCAICFPALRRSKPSTSSRS